MPDLDNQSIPATNNNGENVNCFFGPNLSTNDPPGLENNIIVATSGINFNPVSEGEYS